MQSISPPTRGIAHLRTGTLVLCAALLALAACNNGGDDEAASSPAGQNSANSSANTSTNSAPQPGDVVIEDRKAQIAGLPAGFDIYPNAAILSSSVVGINEDKGAIIMMESNASVQEMINYYRGKAAEANVVTKMDIATKTGKIIGGQREDGLTFSFSAQKSGDGTLGQLSIGKSVPYQDLPEDEKIGANRQEAEAAQEAEREAGE